MILALRLRQTQGRYRKQPVKPIHKRKCCRRPVTGDRHNPIFPATRVVVDSIHGLATNCSMALCACTSRSEFNHKASIDTCLNCMRARNVVAASCIPSSSDYIMRPSTIFLDHWELFAQNEKYSVACVSIDRNGTSVNSHIALRRLSSTVSDAHKLSDRHKQPPLRSA